MVKGVNANTAMGIYPALKFYLGYGHGHASVVSIMSMVCMCVRLFPQLSGLETEEVVKGVSANTAVHTRGYRSLKSYLGDGCGGGVQTTSLCCLCSIHKSITLLDTFIVMQEIASLPCEYSASSYCDQCGRQNAEFACSVYKQGYTA